MRSILVVDDNRDLARGVALVLGELPARVQVVHSAAAALAALDRAPVDLVVSDIRMPGMDGMQLLDEVKRRAPGTRVMLLTGYGTIESAVEAMKRGASDYLTKPFEDEELLAVARRALGEPSLAAGPEGFHGIVTHDPSMLAVLDAVRRVAASNATVLIMGESGTGKERVARALHAESPRAARPFVAFNAAAVPETLAESELFGCKKGAYTGADRDRKGLFCEADGGTLFIDEVSCTSPALQGKLLRALEAREVLPVGSATPVKVDVRIVAASNDDLARMVRDGSFRRDLYYRLSVVKIALPPLRERRSDIALLAELFLARHGGGRSLSPAALARLEAHPFSGNVRELMNVIERAALLARGPEIGVEDIALDDPLLDDRAAAGSDVGAGLPYEEAKGRILEQFQRHYVERILAECRGNLSAAARRAGITRAALHRIVKRLGIGAEDG